MAPYATMILVLPATLLEGNGVLEWLNTHPYPWSALIIIFSSGVLAFCLNFSIFYVIHSTTAVTFNVAGNLKVRYIRQCFKLITIFFSFLTFKYSWLLIGFNSWFRRSKFSSTLHFSHKVHCGLCKWIIECYCWGSI